MDRFARAFELAVSYFGISMLLLLIVATNTVPTSFAEATTAAVSNSSCAAPSFYSLTVTPASLNTTWSLPLISTIDSTYTTTVTATGLPPGITLQDQKTTLAAGGAVLHNWILSGAPTMLGTYVITVTAQNSCGGASTVVTLPINNIVTAQGTALCPAGTVGTYPNCVSSTAATVSFDASTLTQATANPTITGTSNTQTVNLTVQNTSGATVYNSPATSVVGGKWSVQLSNLLGGIYKLYLYSNGTLLVPATLNITLSSTVVPASNSIPITNISAAVSAAPACLSFAGAMQMGGKGSAVVELQNFLIGRGLLAAGNNTGHFGALTRSAVQQFQRQQRIVSSGNESTTGFGLVGARTRAAMQANCQGNTSTTFNPSTAVQPLTNLPSCPQIPVPLCNGGTLVSLGVDTNHCSLGYQCRQSTQTQTQQTQQCPYIAYPTCSAGALVTPLGTDYNGCNMGYTCQQVSSCPTYFTPTCGANQTLVSGTGANGCALQSYCSDNTTAHTCTSAGDMLGSFVCN